MSNPKKKKNPHKRNDSLSLLWVKWDLNVPPFSYSHLIGSCGYMYLAGLPVPEYEIKDMYMGKW